VLNNLVFSFSGINHLNYLFIYVLQTLIGPNILVERSKEYAMGLLRPIAFFYNLKKNMFPYYNVQLKEQLTLDFPIFRKKT